MHFLDAPRDVEERTWEKRVLEQVIIPYVCLSY
jgi:hypothetical protein